MPLPLGCYPTLQTKSGSLSPNLLFRLNIAFNRPHLRRWRHQCRCWFTLTYQHCNVKNWRYSRRWEDIGPFEFSVPPIGPWDEPSNPYGVISWTFTYLKHHPKFFNVVNLWCLCILLFPSRADPTMPWFPTSFVEYDVCCFSLKVDLTTWCEVVRFVGLGCCSCFWVSSFHLHLGVFFVLCHCEWCFIFELMFFSVQSSCYCFVVELMVFSCAIITLLFHWFATLVASLLSQIFFCVWLGWLCTCFIIESILFFCATRLLLFMFHWATTIVASLLSWSFLFFVCDQVGDACVSSHYWWCCVIMLLFHWVMIIVASSLSLSFLVFCATRIMLFVFYYLVGVVSSGYNYYSFFSFHCWVDFVFLCD
jgi:hypothetical protein